MKIGSDTHRKLPLLYSTFVEEKPKKRKGRFRGSFPLICSISPPILAPLSKPKSKPPPISTLLSLPKSKPPHLSLSFSKPKSKLYPKNYNLNLKRKRNKRKPRGSERSLTREGDRDKKMKIQLYIFSLGFNVCFYFSLFLGLC